MSEHPSTGLPGFLEVVCRYPSPTAVLDQLISGPLARFGALFGHLWEERAGVLHLLADSQASADLSRLYARVSVDVDMPVSLSFRESEVIVVDMLGLDQRFSALAGAEHRAVWDDFSADARVRSALMIPIVSRGLSRGVVGVACSDPVSLGSLEISFLDGIGAALGLWLTHPTTPIARVDQEPDLQPRALTARQRQILRLVREGRSNSAIAATLGFSESTIKQELQRMQRMLQATSRFAAAERAWELGLLPAP